MTCSFLNGAQDRMRPLPALFGIYASVVLLAYGFTMFNLTLAGDDWAALQYRGFRYDLMVSFGRWMNRIVWSLAEDNGFAPPFTLAFLCAAYLVVSIACCLCLGAGRRESYLIFACVLVCFPINAEPFSFKMLHLNFGIGLLLATASGLMIVRGHEFLFVRERTKAAVLGLGAAAAFMLAASVYQTLALFACAIVLLRVVGLLRERLETPTMLLRSAGLLSFAVAAFLIGGGLYWGVIHAVSRVTGIPLRTTGLYAVSGSFVESWAELRRQVGNGFSALSDLLFTEHPLFPLTVKITFLAATVLLAVIFALGWDKDDSQVERQEEQHWNGIARACVFLGVVLLLFLVPLALGMLRKVAAIRYNNLIGIALPHAMVYAILYDVARDIFWRRGVAILASIVIGIFVFEQNRAAVTTFLLNRRDLSIANRMLERITANPAFAPFAAKGQATIIFYGDRLNDRDLRRPFSAGKSGSRVGQNMIRPIVNCGVFDCQIERASNVFRLISESRMDYQVSIWPNLPRNVMEEEKQRLIDRIKAGHPWPAPDAVIFGTDIIVIILQPPV
jgi:hypothetical protein